MASDNHVYALLCFGSYLLLPERFYSPSSSSSYLCSTHFSIFPLNISVWMSHKYLKFNMLKVNSLFPLATDLVFFLPFLIILKDIAIHQVRNLGAILAFLQFCFLLPQVSHQVLLILSLILLKFTPSHYLHFYYLLSP